MTGNSHQIIRHLFGREHLEEISVDELKDLVDEFPSFNAAHFLLSKKLKQEGLEEFVPATRRTALYFTNPFWLQWLLENHVTVPARYGEVPIATHPVSPAFAEAEPVVAPAPPEEEMPEPFLSGAEAGNGAEAEQPGYALYTSEAGNGSPAHPAESQIETDMTGFEAMHTTAPEEAAAAPVIVERVAQAAQDPDEFMEESLADIALARVDAHQDQPLFPSGETSPAETFEQAPEDLSEQKEQAEVPFHEAHEPHFSGQESIAEAPTTPVPGPAQRPYYFWEKEFYSKKSAPESQSAEAELSPAPIGAGLMAKPGDGGPEPAGSGEAERADIRGSGLEEIKTEAQIVYFDEHPILDIHAAPDPSLIPALPAVEKETVPGPFIGEEPAVARMQEEEPVQELRFEPYHTIDYFASQGIKYEQEENPTDKFGKQLKSFTAWLKTMKKLPVAVLETEMSELTEAAIQSIAEHSVEEKEVITEAMAEVLALQGKTENAIELYHKLSLLNPSKSAFFAARIEQLKGK